jgi:hypothetical protein
MVEFHFQTPEHIRLRSNEYRLCHRLAVRGMLPEQVRNRACKAEFSTTLRRYVDDFDEAGAFPLGPYASMWLRPDQWSSILLRSRQHSGGAALWSLWGLFGCALLAKLGLAPRAAKRSTDVTVPDFSASSGRLDLNGEAKTPSEKQSSADISL